MTKLFANSLSLLAASLLLIGGCSTTGTPSWVTPANARLAASLVCSNTLIFASSDAERAKTADYIYSIAHGVRTLSGGNVPTPLELKHVIDLFAPGAGKYAVLATSLQAIYGGLYSQIQGDPKKALEYLEAIAAGCEDAATIYRPSPTPTPSP